MPHGKTAQEIFDERIGPTDPARSALSQRLLELKELQEQGDPAFQTGSQFFSTRTGGFVQNVLGHLESPPPPLPLPGTGSTGLDPVAAERIRGRERLKLEATLHSLALELLPPEDVETAMLQVRRGELVKSKLAFQAVLQNLADASANAERLRDLELAEENQDRTLRDARARITIDMVGKDLGRAILFALSGSGGGGGGE